MLIAGDADRVAELRGFPLKRAFADHVDGAGERVRGIGGRRHLGDLHALDVEDIDPI